MKISDAAALGKNDSKASRDDAPVTDSGQVVRQLIEHIRLEGLNVGDRLPSIRQLAETLQVNPSVARDTLIEAQTKGLVKIKPRSGAYIQSLDFSSLVDALSDTLETALAQKDPNLFHLIETRSIIEGEAVATACVRRRAEDLSLLREALEPMGNSRLSRQGHMEADERFHLTIASVAGNSVMVIVLRALLVLLRPYRLKVLAPIDKEATFREHEMLYSCIVRGEADRSRDEMRRHILVLQERLIDAPGPVHASRDN